MTSLVLWFGLLSLMGVGCQESPFPEPSLERRGFAVEINHQERQIVFRAWFFAAHPCSKERRQVDAIVGFWQKQNQRFAYRLDQSATTLDYELVFDLRRAEGQYNQHGFFVPAPRLDPSLMNQVELVPAEAMPRLGDLQADTRIVGYAPNNFIYIADDMAQHLWIGIHEAGHRLGAGHTRGGVMRPSLWSLERSLDRRTVSQMLACAGIVCRGRIQRRLAKHPVRAMRVVSRGQAPEQFYKGGKLVRLP